MHTTRITRWAASAAIGATLALVPLAASSAGAATAKPAPGPAVSATTHISNNYDDGGNGFWSNDNPVTRVITFAKAASQTGAPAGDTLWTARVHDEGDFNAIVGGFTPNQGGTDLGLKISRSTSGTFTGSASYTFQAPTADVPSYANVAATVNDNFTKPESGPDSTGQWFLQLFTAPEQAAVTGTIGNDWTWTYVNKACPATQSWTDAATNGDGQSATAGNITGATCHVTPPPPPASPYTVQAKGHIQSEQSHKYLAVVDGKLVQESLRNSSEFEIVLTNTTHLQGLELLSNGKASGWFVSIPDSGQATIVHSFVATSKHGSYYNSADGHVLNNARYSTAPGNPQIGWTQVKSANEQYTTPGQ